MSRRLGARQAGSAFRSEYHRYHAASASGTNNFNAIDPDVTFDESGVPWLSFGSFWDGMKMRRLDRSTGPLLTVDTHPCAPGFRGGAVLTDPTRGREGAAGRPHAPGSGAARRFAATDSGGHRRFARDRGMAGEVLLLAPH